MAEVIVDSFTIESNMDKINGEPVYRIRFHVDIFPMKDESARNIDILSALENYFREVE